jgi:lipid II:glycine glycyltransferase (peptidoglycan interpeptide bridge formation enzyme)
METGPDYPDVMKDAGFERNENIKPYHTILFPLEIDPEEMRLKFHNKWRASLRKAEKNDMQVYETQDIQTLLEFERIYQQSQERKGFTGLNVGEFIQAQEKLPAEQKLNIIVIKKDNDLLSVDINSYLGDTSLGIFQSTTEKGLSLGASYLAWWNTFQVAKRVGMRRYDMGGIDPVGNPNVYQFKQRMGGDEVFHLGCFEAYASRSVKRICSLLDTCYRWIKRKK